MAISIDSLTLQPVAAPISAAPVRQAPVTAVGERDGANNDRRNPSKDARGRSSVAFRSFLDAATLAGLTKTLGAQTSTTAATDEAPAPPPRRAKLPEKAEQEVLSASESERLYHSAKISGQGRTSPAPEFLAATSRYAKSFFAVSGTFARPGESLELTA